MDKELLEIKPWPFNGYAPGNYNNTCSFCKSEIYNVDKLCFVCLECAVRIAHQAASPASPVREADIDESSALWAIQDIDVITDYADFDAKTKLKMIEDRIQKFGKDRLAARTEGDGKEIKGNDGVLYDALLEAYDSKPPLQKNPFQSIGDRNRLIVIFRKHGLVITKIPSPPKTT
jgi:hypothetical protein